MATTARVLADGRRLAWREYGKAAGFPIFFFHGKCTAVSIFQSLILAQSRGTNLGNLNSRKFAPAWENTESLAERANARIIALDRPGLCISQAACHDQSFLTLNVLDAGYGDSTFFPERTYSTWAKDVHRCFADDHSSHLAPLSLSFKLTPRYCVTITIAQMFKKQCRTTSEYCERSWRREFRCAWFFFRRTERHGRGRAISQCNRVWFGE